MSKILSYNEKANGSGGWFNSKEYEDDEIKAIKDPNGGLTKSPKTAIPSPFAQMDLVKNAFLRLSQDDNLKGAVFDEKLVSNALDVAQIFFEFDNYADLVKVITWKKTEMIALMKEASPLLGATLEMFLRQDAGTNHFERMDALYFLSYKGEIVGGTSPASLFIATPNVSDESLDEKYGGLKIGDNDIFSHWQPLYKRDKDFVVYLYYLFSAFEELDVLDEVRKYLQTNFALLKRNNPLLHQQILDAGLDPGKQANDRVELRERIENDYELLDGVSVLGVPLYKKKKASQKQAIQKSDFLMRPTYKPTDEEGKEEDLPLVLPNQDLNPVASDPYVYVENTLWRDSDAMKEAVKMGSKEKLPNTNYSYPWRSARHFFTESLIQLVFPIDNQRFFDGNLEGATRGYLLPIKEEFFRYFSAEDLCGTLNGKPRFQLEQKGKDRDLHVKATLRIPVSKGNGTRAITLTRVYRIQNNDTYNLSEDEGAIIELPFSLSIFPFVRAGNGTDSYRIQSIKQNIGNYAKHEAKLNFYKSETGTLPEDEVKRTGRQAAGGLHTDYYALEDNFDYLRVTLADNYSSHEGVVLPLWRQYKPGNESAFTFAVDFGTTNTHVEVMKGRGASEALHFAAPAEALVATLHYNPRVKTADASLNVRPIFPATLKQEFLPIELGKDYGFPQRTVISEKSGLSGALYPLRNVNIPFIYEKEDTGLDNKIIPNLKWKKEYEAHAKAYIEELVMLLRAKVLLDGGKLDETKIVWFYPLSMQRGSVNALHTTWEETFQKCISPNADKAVFPISESIAPYYYYGERPEFTGSTLVSVDIGGGTSDVVIIGKDSKPVHMSSIRFAANVLFGDGFEEAQADNNPMLRKYYRVFHKLLDGDDKFEELKKILDKIWKDKHSEDVNAFLFSLVNSPAVQGDDAFSYNKMLRSDNERKIIFLYFYATLIYYVARLMMDRGVEMPKAIMFSGTGSKVLDVLGSQRQLDELTQDLLEAAFGKKYGPDGFSVVLERKEPKQITCKGGLKQLKNDQKTIAEVNREIHSVETTIKTNFYLLPGHKELLYKDMQSDAVLDATVAEVQKFNAFFLGFCEARKIVDAFALDRASYRIFTEQVGKNLKNFLVAGWKFVNRNSDLSKGGEEPVEDVPFLYPVIGSIRKNLINNIGKEE
jgi:hypothetical protein